MIKEVQTINMGNNQNIVCITLDDGRQENHFTSYRTDVAKYSFNDGTCYVSFENMWLNWSATTAKYFKLFMSYGYWHFVQQITEDANLKTLKGFMLNVKSFKVVDKSITYTLKDGTSRTIPVI